MEYNTVCGLEVHTELSTKTKIFCNCSTAFGGEPNSHVCEICAGMPGTLPVVNERVVEYAVRTGLATNCTITRYNKFDRKNYFSCVPSRTNPAPSDIISSPDCNPLSTTYSRPSLIPATVISVETALPSTTLYTTTLSCICTVAPCGMAMQSL